VIRCLDASLPGNFATWTFRHLDVSIPGRFATSLDVSTPDDRLANDLTVSQTDETSREVAKRPGIKMSKGGNHPGGEMSRHRTIQVASRPGSESSKVVAKRPGGELAK